MELRSTFQSIIALHQEELPLMLNERETKLPVDSGRIVTVTGIRRCGKSSLLGLVMNRLIENGVSRQQILCIGFDDERFLSISVENLDEILQAYREMFPNQPLKDVYMFFDEIQLVEGWELFVLRVYKTYCPTRLDLHNLLLVSMLNTLEHILCHQPQSRNSGIYIPLYLKAVCSCH